MPPHLNTKPSKADATHTLYLAGETVKNISCTDSALVVTNSEKQMYRQPIQRLSRIISSSLVNWSGKALTLCMQNGVCITWLDSQGVAVGSARPKPLGDTSFATALDILLSHPIGVEYFEHWLRSRRMDILIRWRSSRGHISPQTWEKTKREWVYAKQHAEHLPPLMRAHCMAYVTAQLHAYKIPSTLWSYDARPLPLDDYLTNLLWAEMNLCNGNMSDKVRAEKEIAKIFDHWHIHNGSALIAHLQSLHRIAAKECLGE